METLKAGCYLLDKNNMKIGLIYREKLNDYSFPKGHLENLESLMQCAIRETAEETKRDCVIVNSIPPIIDRYTTPKGEQCLCYMFVAVDIGKSDNDSLDTHELIWVDIDKVESILSYDDLKKHWLIAKEKILEYVKD